MTAIWAQLSEPLAVQPEKVEPVTSSTAVATDRAAPPPLKVEQSWKLEPETVVFCSATLVSIADTAPLRSHTCRLLNTQDETFRDDAPATCTTLSMLVMSEKTESTTLSREPFMAIWAQLMDPVAVQSSNVELTTSNESVVRSAAAPPTAVEQFANTELDILADCSPPPLDPTAYSAPLVLFTDSLRNVLDATVSHQHL